MPCEVIGANTASGKHEGYGRGAIYHAIDTPAVWGPQLANDNQLFICTVSDATAAEIIALASEHGLDGASYTTRWLITPPQVAQMDGETFTFAEFQSFLVDQSL